MGANPLKISGAMVGWAQVVHVPLVKREVSLHLYRIRTIKRDKNIVLGTFQIAAKSILLSST